MDICWLREISWWVFNRKNLTIYSFFTQPCDIKQSLLSLDLFYLFVKKKKERTYGVAVIYRICLGVIPLWMFCIMTECILCLTNISILCEGLCESTDKGQGKRMCMLLTIIPNTATYPPHSVLFTYQFHRFHRKQVFSLNCTLQMLEIRRVNIW